ncbi:MAG: DJ-1/PfpI family protein [Candidatus Sumerlaeia bacterium]|nr:DJ-1/PfpI family protein [Candidatus Sumerlaeia bacterium]
MRKFFIKVIGLILLTMLSGCGEKSSPPATTSFKAETSTDVLQKEVSQVSTESAKKVVMIIASQNFRDEELLKPKEILEKNGYKVTIASSSLAEATGMLGAKVKPDILVKDINVADFSAIIFVGGTGSSEYWENATAHQLAQSAVSQGKVLGAICIAPITLAKAGVLKGKKATVWQSETGRLISSGAYYTGANVEVDGKIITADGPASAEAFGKALVAALASK